jgi:hypothetical protein
MSAKVSDLLAFNNVSDLDCSSSDLVPTHPQYRHAPIAVLKPLLREKRDI